MSVALVKETVAANYPEPPCLTSQHPPQATHPTTTTSSFRPLDPNWLPDQPYLPIEHATIQEFFHPSSKSPQCNAPVPLALCLSPPTP